MTDFTVASGRGQPGRDVASPDPPPLINLTDAERQVYDYICKRLKEAGVEHVTAGLPIVVIVRTYSQWLDALELCTKNGRTQESKTGWVSEMPWAADERRLKMELGQWLPKACLTIPSLTRVRKDEGDKSGQDDLFAALVEHGSGGASGSPPSGSRH